MRKHSTILIFAFGSVLVLSSCMQILGDIIFPNRCVRCEVKNWSNSFWSSSECGGGRDLLETECKAKAYDLHDLYPDAECDCNYYTQPKTE